MCTKVLSQQLQNLTVCERKESGSQVSNLTAFEKVKGFTDFVLRTVLVPLVQTNGNLVHQNGKVHKKHGSGM
jgi:hypothetical protein